LTQRQLTVFFYSPAMRKRPKHGLSEDPYCTPETAGK
jgi:hypothetical protein